jgi:nitronate monooxygenase
MMLTELLGIELPIVQAPMAGVQGSALAIAVSTPDPAVEAAWPQVLRRYYDELGVDSRNVRAGAGREPFSHAAVGTQDRSFYLTFK